AGEVGRGAGHQEASEAVLPVGVEARQAMVGKDALGLGVVAQLPVVGHDPRVPAAPAAIDAEIAPDRKVGAALEVAAGVLEVAWIAGPGQVGARLPVAVDGLLAAEAEHAAVVLAAILRQDALVDLV